MLLHYSSVFIDMAFVGVRTWPPCRSEELLLVHFGLFVCPPWYLLSYCRCWVYYPGMYYIFCCFESATGRLQALGPAFTMRIPDNNSSNYGRISSAVILQRDEPEGQEETCLPASLALLLGYLCASFQPPPGPSPGFSLGYQTKIHLVMAQICLHLSCKWTKRRATWSIVALLPWQCCLATCQQVYSRPQALLMTFSSLLGCGLCTGVLSEVLRYLLPGEGMAPASVSGAETTSQLQKVVLDPISGHDLSRHADPFSSVPCKSDCDVGRESPQDYRGVSFIPGPPSCSLASSSGPPFVSYSSGKGWDIMDTMFPDSPQVLVELPRRVPSHPLGSSVSGGSSMVVLGDSTTRGRRSFSPSARLELLLGRVRRRLGRHRRGTLSVKSLVFKPKGTLHQPQGDDGSPGWPLRVQLSSQRQDDRSLLRLCHDSRLPQAIGRHEVSGPVPRSEGDSPVGRIHEDHATSPVNPGVSQHESGSSQSAHPGDGFGMDATPGGSPGPSSPVAGNHRPVRYIAVSKAPCVLCSSVAFLQPWDNLQAYAFPPITIITRVLLKLRASHTCDLTLIAPFWPQENGFQLYWTFSQKFQWNYPNVEICCDNRISIGFKTISLCFV